MSLNACDGGGAGGLTEQEKSCASQVTTFQKVDQQTLDSLDSGESPVVIVTLDATGTGAIKDAQDSILAKLEGTSFVLQNRLDNIPTLTGEVHARMELAILECAEEVVGVQANTADPPN